MTINPPPNVSACNGLRSHKHRLTHDAFFTPNYLLFYAHPVSAGHNLDYLLLSGYFPLQTHRHTALASYQFKRFTHRWSVLKLQWYACLRSRSGAPPCSIRTTSRARTHNHTHNHNSACTDTEIPAPLYGSSNHSREISHAWSESVLNFFYNVWSCPVYPSEKHLSSLQ